MISRVNGELQAADGVVLKYSVFGERGTWVVLVHGYMSSGYLSWIRTGIARKLAERHRVAVFDCRNHGISGHPQAGERAIARDVADVMDHLGIDAAHVHGYCMGGAVVLTLLGVAPERFLTASVGGTNTPERRDPVPASPGSRAELLVIAGGDVSGVDLSGVRAPVLSINGSLDDPDRRTERLWREIADFRAVVVPDATHLEAYRHPAYGEYLAGFIDGAEEATSTEPLAACPSA